MSSMHLHSSYVIPSVYENNFLQDVVVSLHASSKFTAVGLSNGEIYIFNLEGEHQRTLRGHEGEVWTMTSWEDSNILISGGHDTLLRIWDTATGECLHTLPGHTSTIRCLAMTASGTVISGSRDTTLRVWNVSSGTCHYVLEGHTDTVRCVVAQGMDIISAGYDNLVKFWSLSSSVCLHTSDDNEEKIFSLAFLKAGRVVASGSLNGDVFLYNVLSHSVLGRAGDDADRATEQRGLITNIKEGEDDTFVTSDNKGNIQVYDIKSSPCERKRSFIAHPDHSVLSLIVFNRENILTSGSDGKLRLWDLNATDKENMAPVAEFGEPAKAIWRVVSAGSRVISALFRGNGIIIEFWDLDIPGHHPEEVKTQTSAPVVLVDSVGEPR